MNTDLALHLLLVEPSRAAVDDAAVDDAAVDDAAVDVHAQRANLQVHGEVSQRIRTLLDAHPHIRLDTAHGLHEAAARLTRHPYDIALLNLPSVLAPLADWRRRFPHLPVLVLACAEDLQLERAALAAGAHDCLIPAQLDAHTLMRTLYAAHLRHKALCVQSVPAQPRQGSSNPVESPREAQLRTIMESNPECVKVVAVDGTLLEINPAGLRMVEADDPASVLHKPVLDLIHPDDRKAFVALHRRNVAGESGELQYRIRGLKGAERWMEAHATPLRAADGNVATVLSVTRDISARKLTEQVMLRIAQVVSMPIGAAFLEHLVTEAMDALQTTAGLIALLDPTEPERVRTVVFFYRGKRQEDFGYDLAGTPCAWVIQGEAKIYPQDLRRLFPEDTMVEDLNLDAYVGAPLVSQSGTVLGLVALLHEYPLPYPEVTLAAVKILAARAAAELERQRVTMELTAGRRQLQSILGSVAEGIHGLDRRGRIIFTNPAALAMLGYREDEVIGQDAHALFHQHHLNGGGDAPDDCPIQLTLQEGQTRSVDLDTFARKDGSTFAVQYVCAPILDGDNLDGDNLDGDNLDGEKNVQGAVVSFINITRRQEDDLLRATENRVLELISAARRLDTILVAVTEGIETLSPQALASVVLMDPTGKIMERSIGPSLSAAYNDAIPGIAIGPRAGSCGTAAYTGERVIVRDIETSPLWTDYRELARAHDLRACWSIPVLDGLGKPLAVLAVYFHTARAPVARELEWLDRLAYLVGIAVARARSEGALRTSEERFRRVFEDAATGMSVVNADGRFIQVNAAYCHMLGYSADELYAMSFLDITHPEDHDLSAEPARTVHLGKTGSYIIEKRYLHKQGHVVWARLSVSMLLDANGAVIGNIAVAEDISQRKEAEAELEQSHAVMRAAAQISKLGGWAIELPSQAVTWSDAVRDLHEVAEDFVIDVETGIDFYAPEDRPALRAALEACVLFGTPFKLDARFVTAKGRRLWVRVAGEAARDARGAITRVYGAFQDVTEQHEAEQSLRETQERFQLLAKATNDAIWDLDLATDRAWVNEGYEILFGYRLEELSSINQAWTDHIHPDDRDAVVRGFYRAIEGLENRWQAEYRFVRADGEIAHVMDRGFVIRDETGRAVRFVGSMTDLTERKKLEVQMLRAQRMESLGILAGGIAHDLNNVLTPILLASFLLKRSVQGEQAQKQLEIIEETATRSAEMVRQVLTFARGSAGDQTPILVDSVVQEVVKLMQDTLNKNIRILVTISEQPWTVLGDSTQLHQVLINLCVNARDAMPNGGTLKIDVNNVTIDEQYANMVTGMAPGPYVYLNVTDTGVGIPKDLQEHLFDPFFTTKDAGKGTGLGLSTVQGIVHSHGGFITLYSEEGRGATFRIYLPASLKDNPALAESRADSRILVGEGELILVVDDEKPLRLITQQTLEAYGYRALLAEDGAEAISLYVQHRAEIAVVITDMMMPVMDGFATIQALRRINPQVVIIAASGLADVGMASKAAKAGVEFILTKPFTAESILSMLANVLGKRE